VDVRLFRGTASAGNAIDVEVYGFETVYGATLFANTIYGSVDNNRLYGGQLADTLSGLDGNDVVFGGLGNDTLFGGNGNDTVSGGAGDDLIVGGFGNDTLDGGTGNDRIQTVDGSDLVIAGDGDDFIYTGGGGNSTVLGGLGNDTLVGGAGNATLRGGEGDDYVNATGDSGRYLVSGEDGNDTILILNGVAFGGAGNDTLTGVQLPQQASALSLYGGFGDDTLILRDATDVRAVVDGGPGDDTFYSINNYASSTNSLQFVGGAGVDTLYMTGGQLTVGQGAFYPNTATGIEVFVFSDQAEYIAVFEAGRTLALNGGDDEVGIATGATGTSIDLGDGADNYFSDAAFSTVSGGLGNDSIGIGMDDSVIYAGDGNDSLSSQGNRSTVYAGLGNDVLSLQLRQGLSGAGASNAFMEEGDDRVFLSDSFGLIDLGDGKDTFSTDFQRSAFDADVIGGLGADTFVFQYSWGFGEIRIKDFDPMEDRLSSWQGATLASFTSVTQVGSDVHLFIATAVTYDPPNLGQTFILENTALSSLSDAIFV
jgi:Ca2+-binding RTX toxin-like protein